MSPTMPTTAAILLAALLSYASESSAKVITLPAGVRAEGVTHARGTNFFAADIITGRILRVDVASGLVTTAVQPSGQQLYGMYATAPGRLFAAGGGAVPALGIAPRAEARYMDVFDIATGDLIASCNASKPSALVNDVVADREYAYYTDTIVPRVYRLSITKLPACEVATIALDPRFFAGDGFRANGIVLYRGGLLVANTQLGAVFFVDLKRDNRVTQVVPDGVLAGADGLAVRREPTGVTLYVAQNSANVVSVWTLSFERTQRRVFMSPVRQIRRPSFQGPSTVAVGAGYLVTANLNAAAGFNATGPFTLTVSKA